MLVDLSQQHGQESKAINKSSNINIPKSFIKFYIVADDDSFAIVGTP